MNKWFIVQSILFLILCLHSSGQEFPIEEKPGILHDRNDTIKTNPVNEDSTVLYYLDSISYLQTVKQKDTNYRDTISKLMEESFLNIRGLYVPGWKIVNHTKIDKLMDFMDKNHFNTLIFDLKNAHGELFFITTNETAKDIKSQAKTDEGRPRSIDLEYLMLRAKEKKIKLTGRHVMFRDEVLYNNMPENRLLEDQYWVDMRNPNVVNYNLALLKEEAAIGLDEIAIDYIRFPETNEFGSFAEKNKQIEEITRMASEVFKSSKTEFGIFVFGYVAWGVDVGIGQTIDGLEALADRIYPMVYPSHFAKGTLDYNIPGDHPYEIIEKSCRYSKQLMDNPDKLVLMLQAFWCPQKNLFLQLKAVHDYKMNGFIIWNASGNYGLYFTYLNHINNDINAIH